MRSPGEREFEAFPDVITRTLNSARIILKGRHHARHGKQPRRYQLDSWSFFWVMMLIGIVMLIKSAFGGYDK